MLPIQITPPPYVPRTEDYRLPCTAAPDLFFPPDGQEQSDEHADRVEAARHLCSGCVMRTECAAWARDHLEPGIWGGRTEDEHGYRPTTRRLTARRPTPTEGAAA
ncbi:WhiB family transcriptional regulator [Streptomyces sp. NPDC020379]|uniref:WhiB family transcriptional regulator n=1 Tax=Streptomyces sp. NPDC020379 TaxID=3365071 RepID=UPI0037A8C80D